MSQWTHVTGTIRIDCFNHEGIEERLKNVLGRTWEYGDAVDPDIKYAPYGSEGSIQYIITENPDESSIAAFIVTFYGDLRDYDNDEAIIEWFETVCKSFCLRQAVITINVERQKIIYGSYTNLYDLDKPLFRYNEIVH